MAVGSRVDIIEALNETQETNDKATPRLPLFSESHRRHIPVEKMGPLYSFPVPRIAHAFC